LAACLCKVRENSSTPINTFFLRWSLCTCWWACRNPKL
jgi:hypothetical protein